MRLFATIASIPLLLLSVPALAHEGGHDHDAPRSAAQAASGAHAGQPASHDEAHGHEEGPETEDMFGFTTGTDVLEPGHYEVSTEAVTSFGKRIGRDFVMPRLTGSALS